MEAHATAGFQPPEPKDFANHAGGNATALNDIFEVAVAEGFLVKVAEGVYLHADTEAAMRRVVTDRLRTGLGATVAEIRDLLGTTGDTRSRSASISTGSDSPGGRGIFAYWRGYRRAGHVSKLGAGCHAHGFAWAWCRHRVDRVHAQ